MTSCVCACSTCCTQEAWRIGSAHKSYWFGDVAGTRELLISCAASPRLLVHILKRCFVASTVCALLSTAV